MVGENSAFVIRTNILDNDVFHRSSEAFAPPEKNQIPLSSDKNSNTYLLHIANKNLGTV